MRPGLREHTRGIALPPTWCASRQAMRRVLVFMNRKVRSEWGEQAPREAYTTRAVPTASEFGELVPDCVAHQLTKGVKHELFHDFRPMILNRASTDVEQARNLLVALAFGKQLDDLAFARTEATPGWWCCFLSTSPTQMAQDHLRSGMREEGSSLQKGFHRGNEIPFGIRLEDVTTGPRAQRLFDEFFRGVHGEDQDSGMGRGFKNLCSGIEPVEFGHADVEDGNLGAAVRSHGHSLSPVARFTDYFPFGMGLQQGAQPATDDSVIVSNQDGNSFHTAPPA